MASPTHMRSLYRSLLRELPPRPILATPRSSLHLRIRESFIPGAAAPTTPRHGEQFVAYLRSQRQYAALVDRYNQGMDMSEEERVRLSARRVGMNLPTMYTNES